MEKIYEEVLTNLSKKQSEIKIKTDEIDAARKAELEKKKKEEEEAAIKANDTIASDTIL